MQDLFQSTVVLAPPTANLLISFLLPLLVAASAKLVAPAWVKAFINLGLATALGVITILSQAGVEGVPLKRLLVYVVVTMIASDLAYNYIWKPLGIWPLIQQWTSGFGFGGKATEQPMNPRDVLTPPPGGVGEGPSARTANYGFTMETGLGFNNEGNLETQLLVSAEEAGMAPAHVEGTEVEIAPPGEPFDKPRSRNGWRTWIAGGRWRGLSAG